MSNLFSIYHKRDCLKTRRDNLFYGILKSIYMIYSAYYEGIIFYSTFFSIVACKDQVCKLNETKKTSLTNLRSEDKQVIQEIKGNSFKRASCYFFDIDNYVKKTE